MGSYLNYNLLLKFLIIWVITAIPVSGNEGPPPLEIKVFRHKSVILRRERSISRVSVVKKEIADVNLLGPRQIQLIGIAPGSTQLILWYDNEHSESLDIRVNRGFEVEVISGTGLDSDRSLQGW